MIPKKKKISAKVLAIDPGQNGALVLYNGAQVLKCWLMPLKDKKTKDVDFDRVHEILWEVLDEHGKIDVFLEKAVSFGMGTKGAFNYGRGFAALEIAIKLSEHRLHYIEPSRWTKTMHHGISKDLKPKVKSLTALHLNHKPLVKALPTDKKGQILDGPVDALLIAIFGLTQINSIQEELDFF